MLSPTSRQGWGWKGPSSPTPHRGAYTQLNKKERCAGVFMVPCSRDGFCKWFSTGLDTRNCPWKRFEHIATTALPCRASTLWILHFLFPNSRPRYTLLQRIRRKHALLKAPVVDGNDYVNPFTHEQMRELMLDVAFWLQETLFAHYWEIGRAHV